MEQRRFLLFIVLSAAVMFGYTLLRTKLFPPPQIAPPAAQQADAGRKAPPKGQAAKPDDQSARQADERPKAPARPEASAQKPEVEEERRPGKQDGKRVEEAPPAQPCRLVTLGSLDPRADHLLVVLNSRGAAVERVELNSPKYRDLEDKSGYLGHLGLKDEPGGGCRVGVVGPGTPAANARPASNRVAPGLQADDLIRAVDGQPLASGAALLHYLKEKTKPGRRLGLSVQRAVNGKTTRIEFTAELATRPLEIIRPEPDDASGSLFQDPLSCLLTLQTVSAERKAGQSGVLNSLLHDNWRVSEIEKGRVVEFRYALDDDQLKEVGQTRAVEIVKRYRLPSVSTKKGGPDPRRTYHIELTLEIHNRGSQGDLQVVYRLDGPNGLPLEGWWYSRKSRDIIWRGSNSQRLLGCVKIHKNAVKKWRNGESPTTTLLDSPGPASLKYVGVDTQYFASVLMAGEGDEAKFIYQDADALPLGDFLENQNIGTTNASFQLVSQPLTIPAGKSFQQNFLLFAGPKDPPVLEQYGLGDAIAYGWFGGVAKPLSWLLHLFYRWVRNYGVAIIMLTVLVRGCMFPISRKAAANAQMMQQLAPEIKKIAEKYKNDAEKRMQAQRELYRKHNFNPFGGCLLMFLQLPVFIGLYRSLWVDINLRQAPLIPGVPWCSNLAGPDMLLYWKDWMPFSGENGWLGGENGWLGPYLNILPIFTIVLFLVQQKMFTPPATDEQTRMQQNMMKYMMIFMGVMFFKVASGLCIYFIASSLWSIAERYLLPKTAAAAAATATAKKTAATPKTANKPGPNGASRQTMPGRKQKRK